MSTDRYADPTRYWSESQGGWVSIADLPMPHVRNVYAKCLRNDRANFVNSPLGKALAQMLIPSRSRAKTLIATKGSCSYYAPDSDKHVRAMFYRIGKTLGVKIATTRKGDFIEATAERIVGQEVQIHIKHKNRFRGSRR